MIKSSFLYVLFICVMACGGCTPKSDPISELTLGTSPDFDFEALLLKIDDAIGDRSKLIQMDLMTCAHYDYDGPAKTVSDIVEPIAADAGFLPADSLPILGTGESESDIVTTLSNETEADNQIVYLHPSGYTLVISRMSIADNANADTLTVQLIVPVSISEFAPKSQEP